MLGSFIFIRRPKGAFYFLQGKKSFKSYDSVKKKKTFPVYNFFNV